MKRVIENYINGNLRDAREGAKRYSAKALRECLINEYGYTLRAAVAISDWLKDGENFQRVCDIVAADKEQSPRECQAILCPSCKRLNFAIPEIQAKFCYQCGASLNQAK